VFECCLLLLAAAVDFFWRGGERVQHVLDADGLVIKLTFPPRDSDGRREFKFLSRFVETEQMKAEAKANEFLYRFTFGTGPWRFAEPPRRGLNEDPWEVPLLSKLAGNALKTEIKNSANTQVICFGGKVLALFEAGRPACLTDSIRPRSNLWGKTI